MITPELRALALAATPGAGWTCWRCEQRNAGWTTTCGRCELDRITPERILAMIAVIEAAKAMHVEYDQDLYTTATNKAFKAALAKLEQK